MCFSVILGYVVVVVVVSSWTIQRVCQNCSGYGTAVYLFIIWCFAWLVGKYDSIHLEDYEVEQTLCIASCPVFQHKISCFIYPVVSMFTIFLGLVSYLFFEALFSSIGLKLWRARSGCSDCFYRGFFNSSSY